MGSSIQFDATQVLGRLDAIRSTQIRYAGGRALNQLGWDLRKHHQQWMKAGGFKKPVPFTINSPRKDREVSSTASELSLRFYISPDGAKGSSPAAYLYPVSTVGGAGRKTAFETLFAKYLRKAEGGSSSGITNLHPVPFTQGGHLQMRYGNFRPDQYQMVMAGLKRQDGSYFSIPDNRSTRKQPEKSGLPRGIYRRKGMQFLFGYLDRPPSINTKYDWFGITDRYAKQHFPALLSEALEKALR